MLTSSRTPAGEWPPANSQAHESDDDAPCAAFPLRETPFRAVTRWILGVAYALHPQRIGSLPHLTLLTARDLMRGGTRLPDQNRTWAYPDTFGGVVRDLTPESYLEGLRRGFFPWAHCGPLKWWTRAKRMVLSFDNLHISRRLLRHLKSGKYTVTFDMAFDRVVAQCGAPRAYNWHTLTWLTPSYMRLFSVLNRQGHAHSFEVWNEQGELVGGGYGVAIGRVFFTESQFSHESNSSKMGFASLMFHLAQWGYVANDGKDPTPTLDEAGFQPIPRADFEQLLREHGREGDHTGAWAVTATLAEIAEWEPSGVAKPAVQPAKAAKAAKLPKVKKAA